MKKNILNGLLFTTTLLTEINTYCMNNNNNGNYNNNQMAINLLTKHINFINETINTLIVEIKNLRNADENSNIIEINNKSFRLESFQELKITNQNLLSNIENNPTLNGAQKYKFTLSYLKTLYPLE